MLKEECRFVPKGLAGLDRITDGSVCPDRDAVSAGAGGRPEGVCLRDRRGSLVCGRADGPAQGHPEIIGLFPRELMTYDRRYASLIRCPEYARVLIEAWKIELK